MARKPISEEERNAERDRAFGMFAPKTKPRTEWQEHRDVAAYMRLCYPSIRFYSTYDGFYLGSQYAQAHPLRWMDTASTLEDTDKNGNGVPDLFVFHNNGKNTMLVIELKRSDVSVNKKDGTAKANKHYQRQREWLEYLKGIGAHAVFASGAKEAIEIIKQYVNVKNKK